MTLLMAEPVMASTFMPSLLEAIPEKAAA